MDVPAPDAERVRRRPRLVIDTDGPAARDRAGGDRLPEVIGRRAPLGLPCHGQDPNLWFAESPTELERAKALCGPCPVRPACLAGALQRREPSGVWGGEILVGGHIVARKRPRGRPRKQPVPPAADH